MAATGSEFNAVEDLWSLANAITGFSIAQQIAFAFALAGDLGGLQKAKPKVKFIIAATIIIFSAIYSAAVAGCAILAGGAGVTQPGGDVWEWVTWGRMAAIELFAVTGIAGMYMPVKLEKKKS